MNFNECVNYLTSIETKAYNISLANIKNNLKSLNNPQNNYKTIHIAGTNGKGSTSAFLSSILTESGLKVGLYTSPHLSKINERIKINNFDIPDEEFAKTFTKIYNKNLTYFESLTSVAYQYFSDQNVDIAVIEVGLGGRLDATNVILPKLSIITNIALEHQKFLGSTIEKIANEKARIIKPNVPLITSANEPALSVLKEIANKNNSEVIIPKPYDYKLSLNGDFQKMNASLAIKAAQMLNINEKTIRSGLLKTKWPARLEYIKPNIIIDCAHNVDGLKHLAIEIKKIKKSKNKNITTICGFLKDKNIEEMLKIIESFSDKIILIKPDSHRAFEPKDLAKLTSKPYKIIDNKSIASINYDSKILYLITGSIYLVSEFI